MIIDEKGRLFKKINIIDLALVLIIVISVAATVYKFGFSKHKAVVNSDTKITYVVKVKAIRDVASNALNVGDNLYEKGTKKPIGKITDKKVVNAKEFVNMADGTLSKQAEIPERYDVYLTVESQGTQSDEGYFLDGNYQIGVFSSISFFTRTVDTTGTVTEIK